MNALKIRQIAMQNQLTEVAAHPKSAFQAGHSAVTAPITAKVAGKASSATSIPQYRVLDCIRFIAICAVVWAHCTLGLENKVFHSASGIILQTVALQAGKMGTILFYLISGILLNSKIEKFTWGSFLKAKLTTILYPWIKAVAFFCFLMFIATPQYNIFTNHENLKNISGILLATLNATLFHTTYWFILVYFLSAFLLILFKKNVYKYYTGIFFGAATLFYCVNLYFHWVSVYHTKDFFAYAFIMWAGIKIGQNFSKVTGCLARTSWFVMIGALAVTTFAACWEAYILTQRGCLDAFSCLRITNLIQATVIFICLLKLGDMKLISSMNPRKYTYNIYLVHFMVVYEITLLLDKYPGLTNTGDAYHSVLNQTAFFIVAMLGTFVILKAYEKIHLYLLEKFYIQKSGIGESYDVVRNS